ncbi:uncharacterized protein LOC130623824 [Hydractinia symbiolongicarpus]|uniref:uncharacterized protein LOC130623824 n=1 Tax=Hydractinia symbiolongicarpus TaxID=13093 RepID=UPI00254D3AA3|nr:uncharacterized protein LOC130623824 [Hydractinia symbiolongicarpus]XP_057295335.1 uncharacterized protein LOC130623824 [Hydractinia symbiolongicarpus]
MMEKEEKFIQKVSNLDISEKPLLVDLPEFICSLIASYLNLNDFRNYRLTCSFLCQSTYSRIAMINMNINFDFLTVSEKELFRFTAFMEKMHNGKTFDKVKIYGSCYAPHFEASDKLCTALTAVKDTLELETYCDNLNFIGKFCPSIQRLRLHRIWLLQPHKITDQTFSNFPALNEIYLTGRTFPLEVLTWILDGTPMLTSFTLEDITFLSYIPEYRFRQARIRSCFYPIPGITPSLWFRQRFMEPRPEPEPPKMLYPDVQKSMSSVTNIRHWSWQNVVFEKYLELYLPESVSSFVCNLQNEFVKWKPENIQKFSYKARKPSENDIGNRVRNIIYELPCGIKTTWIPETYVNLTHLTLYDVHFEESNFPLCKHLEYLKLSRTKNTQAYLEALSLHPADELKTLTLMHLTEHFGYKKFVSTLNNFDSLEYVKVEESFINIQYVVDELSAMNSCSIKHLVVFQGQDQGTDKVFHFKNNKKPKNSAIVEDQAKEKNTTISIDKYVM